MLQASKKQTTTLQKPNDPTQKHAVITGLSLILIAILAGFAYGFVLSDLLSMKSATEVITKLQTSELLFSSSIAAWGGIFLLEFLLTWALYKVFATIDETWSRIAAVLRLSYTAFLGVAITQLIVALRLSQTDNAGQFINAVSQYLNRFHDIWQVGLLVFAFHLLALAVMVFKSNRIPKVLAYLLAIAFVGYIVTGFGQLFVPSYETYKMMIELLFSIPMVLGELGLGLWLLFKGRTLETAALNTNQPKLKTNIQLQKA